MRISNNLFKIVIFGYLFVSLLYLNVRAGDLIVSWDPNTEPDLMGYKVYYGTVSRNYTTVIDVGNNINHRVTGLVEGVQYFFAVTAYDTAHNESDFSIEVSATIQVADITPPTIQSLKIVSATQLDVTFSEQVEKASAENLSNYQISGGIMINSIELDSNQRVVHITTSAHQAGSYTITINNVKDLAPNPNIIAANSKYTYQFVPDDTTPPLLTSVVILDATHVEVTFSEEVEQTSAETIQNYQINPGVNVLQSRLDQNHCIVHLVTSGHQSGTTYTLTVNNIRDRASPPNSIAPNSSKQYLYLEQDHTAPTIYSVNIRNQNLVDVIFSEKVDQTQAENIQNYQINNGVAVQVAILDRNQTTVHLSTSAHQPNTEYLLTINNIVDLAQPPNTIQPNSTYRYNYQPDDTTPPRIVGAEAKDETHVDVTFSEPLERTSAEQANNYGINKGISIIQVLIDADKKIVHLITSPHQTGETYTLTVNNIKDLAPNPNVITANSRVQYTFIYQDREAPRLENVQIVYATYLKVFFNELIERESAENVLNYAINGGVQVLGAILDNSLKLVHLTTSEHQANTTYTLTVNNIRDRSPNRNPIAANTSVQYSLDVDPHSLVIGLNKENYQLAYLHVGDRYYVDRNYTITSIPEEMNGYLWIKTANDDRDRNDEQFLSFQLSEKAKIYVAFDSRVQNFPNWLINDFHRIGKYVGVSEYAQKLDLWEKECDAGIITLGANLAAGAQGVESMYVVLIQTHDSQHPGAPHDMDDPLSLGPANMFLLYQNYPNPFNAGTEIRFQLARSANVELNIYNIIGQTVRVLAHGQKMAGHHLFRWDGRGEDGMAVPSGVYFSRLVIRKIDGKDKGRIIYNDVRKMIMIK